MGSPCPLTVWSLRSKGASKRGQRATIKLIQFTIQRKWKLESWPRDQKVQTTYSRIWLPPYIYLGSINTSKRTDRSLCKSCYLYRISCYRAFWIVNAQIDCDNSSHMKWLFIPSNNLQRCMQPVRNKKWNTIFKKGVSPLTLYLVASWSRFHIMKRLPLTLPIRSLL